MQTIIRQAGEASVGLCKNNKHTKKHDHELSILSKKQKDKNKNTKHEEHRSKVYIEDRKKYLKYYTKSKKGRLN